MDDSRPKTPQVWAIAEKAQQMEVAAGEVGMAIPWFPEDDFCFFPNGKSTTTGELIKRICLSFGVVQANTSIFCHDVK